MLILEKKKDILAIFRIIFQKNGIISDVIIPTAAIFEIFFYHFFFVTLQSMTVSNTLSGAWSNKNIPRQIGLTWSQQNSMSENSAIYLGICVKSAVFTK